MKVHLESTTRTVQLDGIPARIWEGHTESGIPIHAFITRVAVHKDLACEEFERELAECREPTNPDIMAYPRRMTL